VGILRQKNIKFLASLGYIVRTCLKQNKTNFMKAEKGKEKEGAHQITWFESRLYPFLAK
jgi:hypothetical protein